MSKASFLPRTRSSTCLLLVWLCCCGQERAEAIKPESAVPGEVEAKSGPKASGAPELEPQPEPEPEPRSPERENLPTAVASEANTPIGDDLALAVFRAREARFGLSLVCDSNAHWIDEDLDATPCTAPGQQLKLLGRDGLTTATTQPRAKGHMATTLNREGSPLPAASQLWLVSQNLQFDPAARLEPRPMRRPTKRDEQTITAVRADFEARRGENSPKLSLELVAELPGQFGAASVIGVFQFGFDDEGEGGWQVLAALDEHGRLIEVVEIPTPWASSYEPEAVVDIDGDGIEEVLWWSRASGVGVILAISHVEAGRLELSTIMSCMCGPGYADFIGDASRPL